MTVRTTFFSRTMLRRGVLVGAFALLPVVLADPVAGQAPEGLRPAASQSQSQTFNCVGTSVPFTVPSGVTRLTIQADGGQGSTPTSGQGGSNGTGGFGASVQVTGVPVTPGQQLSVLVGCEGGNQFSFGFGSGGDHGVAASPVAQDGGHGGGASAVIISSSLAPLVVAGGGGGGGGGGGFGNGGNGGDAGSIAAAGERGGGDGHGDGGCAACAADINGGDGTGSSFSDAGGGGGGGGGGYVGGGGGHGGSSGGGGGGGGGAGSSYFTPSASGATYSTDTSGGDGVVIISWTTGGAGQTPPGQRPPGSVLPSVRCGDTEITPATLSEFAVLRLRCGVGAQSHRTSGAPLPRPAQ